MTNIKTGYDEKTIKAYKKFVSLIDDMYIWIIMSKVIDRIYRLFYNQPSVRCWLGILLLFSTVLPISQLNSQVYKYEYEHFTKENGLPSNKIYDLAFDEEGKVWISTQSGICTFDGNEFIELSLESNDNSFGNIEIDPNGNLWLVSNNTAISFKTSEKLKYYDSTLKTTLSIIDAIPGAKVHLKDNDNYDAWSDKANNIYLQSHETHQIFQYKGDSLRYIGNQNNIILQSQQAPENTIIYLDSLKYKGINIDTQKIKIYGTYPANPILVEDSVVMTSIYRTINDPDTHEKVLTIVNSENDTIFNEYSYALNYIHNQNKIFLGTDNGLIEYDLETNQVRDINQDLRGVFSTNQIKKILFFNNALWVVSYNGLYKIIKTKPIFKNALIGQIGDSRNIVQYDDDHIIVANGRGVTKLNLISGEETPLVESYQCYSITQVDSFRYILSSYLPNVAIWDSRLPNTVKSFEPNDLSQAPSTETKYFLFSYVDKNNQIWLSSKKGIYRYNIDKNTIERINPQEANYFYSALLENKNDLNTFFAAKENGLEKININTGEIKSYKIFENKYITDVYQDKSDSTIYWVSTRNEGLLKWKYEQNIIRKYTLEDGLKSMGVHSAKQDKQGNIWMSTNHGISVLDQKTDKINTFTTVNGIHNNEYNRHSHLALGDSIFMYGGVDGITYFKPEETVIANDLGPTAILGITYLNKLTGKEVTDQLENPSNSIIKLKSHYLNPQLLLSKPTNTITQTLRYIYSDSKEDWRYTRNNSIPIDDLEPGKNNLIISRQIGINKWSNPKSITVEKSIVWYKNIWTFIGAIAILLICIIHLQRRRNRQIKKINKKIKERVEEQTLELSEKNKNLIKANELNDDLFTIIGHDLRSPISSLTNISRSFEYLETDQEKEKLISSIERNSKNLLTTVDKLIKWSQLKRNSKVELEFVNIIEIIKSTLDLYEDIIHAKKINLMISSETNQIEVFSDYGSLRSVIKNVLSNAIKFSPISSTIKVTVEQLTESTSVSIEDQGSGFTEHQLKSILNNSKVRAHSGILSQKGLGIGLQNSMKLLEAIEGTLHIENINPNGASVRIVLMHNIISSVKKKSIKNTTQ